MAHRIRHLPHDARPVSVSLGHAPGQSSWAPPSLMLEANSLSQLPGLPETLPVFLHNQIPDRPDIAQASAPLNYGTLPFQYNGERATMCADTQDNTAQIHFCPKTLITITCFLGIIMLALGYDDGVMYMLLQEEHELAMYKLDVMDGHFRVPPSTAAETIMALPGVVIGGSLSDFYGRRMALLSASAVLPLAPILMAFAEEFHMAWMFPLGRAVVGFAVGIFLVNMAVYIVEVAPQHLRAQLVVTMDLFMGSGMVLGYVAHWALIRNNNFHPRWLFIIGTILPLLGIALCLFGKVPETPRWLHAHGRSKKAEDILKSTHATGEAIGIMALMDEGEKDISPATSWRQFSWNCCFQSTVRQMMLLATVVDSGKFASGYLVILYFGDRLLNNDASLKVTTILPLIVMVALAKLFGCLVSIAALKWAGRRALLLVSALLVSSASMWIAISTSFSPGWLRMCGFAFFMVAFSIGYGPIATVYTAEVYSTIVRAKGVAFSMLFGHIIGVLGLFIFDKIVAMLSLRGTFFSQALMGLVFFEIMWILLVETGGCKLEDIRQVFRE